MADAKAVAARAAGSFRLKVMAAIRNKASAAQAVNVPLSGDGSIPMATAEGSAVETQGDSVGSLA